MLHLLKRHPFSVRAFFRQSLVLTYAFPSDILQPLLPPGLALDTYGEYGFLAIAMVQTERLHPLCLLRWGAIFSEWLPHLHAPNQPRQFIARTANSAKRYQSSVDGDRWKPAHTLSISLVPGGTERTPGRN